jgi:hypothetical protein
MFIFPDYFKLIWQIIQPAIKAEHLTVEMATG